MITKTNVRKRKRSTYKKINAPFGYFGSKNKIAYYLCENLPPHNCWVEAFCGSAALTLAKPQAQLEIINDIDDEIINFFNQLRKKPVDLYRNIALTPYASKELINARKKIKNRTSKLERARLFLIESMMSINGSFGEERGGFSHTDSYARNGKEARVSRWYNLPERLTYVVERLRDVRIENKNALTLLRTYIKRPATLVYLDPPYNGERTNGYNKDANEDKFHRKLLHLANQAKCMIFISGYQNDLYDSILTPKRGWKKRTIETMTKDTSGTIHKRTEVVWMNKYFNEALKATEAPIKLTKKEKKENKLNPERKRNRKLKKVIPKRKAVKS
jgi:DNA adenine methylase